MKKNPETGNVKNLASADLLLSYCTEFGAKYKPANPALTLPSLQSQYDEAYAAQENVNDWITRANIAINARFYEFDGLASFCVTVVSALTSCGASKQTIKDAKYLLRKLQGRRAAKLILPVETKEGELPAVPDNISASQRSMDQQIEHFSRLIKLLTAEIKYKPNEDELMVTSLSKRLDSMKKANGEVADIIAGISGARVNRDLLLYAPETGIVDISKLTKEYVKSVFKTSGADYKKVRAIPFRTLKKVK